MKFTLIERTPPFTQKTTTWLLVKSGRKGYICPVPHMSERWWSSEKVTCQIIKEFIWDEIELKFQWDRPPRADFDKSWTLFVENLDKSPIPPLVWNEEHLTAIQKLFM